MLLVPIDARFFPGVLVMTPGALEAFKRTGEGIEAFLTRHLRGDWGNLDTHDWKENEYSLRQGFRLLSAYALQQTSPPDVSHIAGLCLAGYFSNRVPQALFLSA